MQEKFIVLNPSQYKGPNMVRKMSDGLVLALCGVPMHLFTMFCPFSEQTKHIFVIAIKNNVQSTGTSDMF